MKKEILFDEELRKKLAAGVKITAKAIKVTMGPCGRNVAVPGPGGKPIITKDGVTVGDAVDLEDPFENCGSQMIKEVSKKTDKDAGDGTTTSAVIAESMVLNGYKMIAAGSQPIDLKRGMDKASETVVSYLRKMSSQVDGSKEKIESIATISANNDSEIGKLIAEAFEKVGKDGIINVEETRSVKTSVEVSEGMSFDESWISRTFITDRERNEVCLENAYVLVTDKKINQPADLINYLNDAASNNRPLFIICDDLEGDALKVVVLNVLQGNVKVAAVKTPGFGNKKKEFLEDVATLVGATVISEDAGYDLKSCGKEFLGSAGSVKITSSETVIIGGGGNKDIIKKYVEELKKLKENSPSPRDKQLISERISKFLNSAATILVGARSETEKGELKYRVEDAKKATKAAIDEGILPGGGYALMLASRELEKTINDKNYPTEDMKSGAKILVEALKAPIKQIAENAGYDGEVVISECIRLEKGFNAKSGQFVDLVEDGVIDPTKVEVSSVENATSVVGTFLTTDAAIVQVEEKDK